MEAIMLTITPDGKIHVRPPVVTIITEPISVRAVQLKGDYYRLTCECCGWSDPCMVTVTSGMEEIRAEAQFLHRKVKPGCPGRLVSSPVNEAVFKFPRRNPR